MDDLTDDELLAEAVADATFDLLTRLDPDARRQFLREFLALMARHGSEQAAVALDAPEAGHGFAF